MGVALRGELLADSITNGKNPMNDDPEDGDVVERSARPAPGPMESFLGVVGSCLLQIMGVSLLLFILSGLLAEACVGNRA